MASYNLLDEGWISCLSSDGRTATLGLSEALARSKEIVEISDQSPLVVASIHRLLLAILQRSLNLVHPADIGKIWKDGDWNRPAVAKYLDQWHGRFDLLDTQRPFYQSPGFKEGKPITVNKMFNELSTANNTILFDHRFDDDTEGIIAKDTARALVAVQSYAMGGGKSATVNFVHATLVGKAMVLIKGRNLFETLSLNLLPMGSSSPISLAGQTSKEQLILDRPIWEADNLDTPGSSRAALGYLDLLTWQSRAINLLNDGNEPISFHSMYMAQGTVLQNEDIFDPMVAYRLSKENGWRPIGIMQEREPWRSMAALVHTSESNKGAANIRFASELAYDGLIPRGSIYRLDVFGMCSDKAKILQWRHARMPFPVSLLKDEHLMSVVTDAIGIAESLEKDLRSGLWELASKMLYPLPGKNPDRNVVNQKIRSFSALRRYWSVLEIPFYSLVNELAMLDSNDHEREKKILLSWAEISVRSTAIDSLNEQIGSINEEARNLRAAVLAKQTFSFNSAKTLKAIRGRYNA